VRGKCGAEALQQRVWQGPASEKEAEEMAQLLLPRFISFLPAAAAGVGGWV
jgi:hypothetical protein